MKFIEVELKFPLLNVAHAIETLDRVAKKEKVQHQVDTYYNHPQRDFLTADPVKEWLRIRETGKTTLINYKNWHHTKEQHGISCDEYETVVENADTLKEIFVKLQFERICVVDKRRTTWEYKDVEVAIDRIEGLGDFIELEARGDHATVEEAKAHLLKVAEELYLELGPMDTKGYPFRLLEKRGRSSQ